MRRVTMMTAAVVLMGAACTQVSGGDASGPAPITAAPTSGPDTARLDVYETLIRYLAGLEQARWETIYVRTTLCGAAAKPQISEGCHDRFSAAEQTALIQRFAGQDAPLVFVSRYGALGDRILSGQERSVFVWMGPIRGDGGTLEVAGSMSCGGLCGQGATWRLIGGDGAWTVSGVAPGSGMWIA